jgi:hypothetical protein
MRKLSLGLLTMFLTCTYINCAAINVNVESTNENIEGLGFTVNGKQHGGMGHSYKGDNMPKGNYTFGVRKKGKDITCFTSDGKKHVKLKADTNATLMFDNKKCVVKLGS